MNRRDAIFKTALGASTFLFGTACNNKIAATTPTTSSSTKSTAAIGIQLFTIPRLVDNDLKGTLKLLSETGYKEVEFFGPYPFSAEATKRQWNMFKQQLGLKNNAFYGYTVQETAAMLKDYGLSAPSFHADLDTMRTGMNKMLDELAVLDAKYVVIPALSTGRSSLEDYKKIAEEFNDFGAQMSKYDMQFVYHNHGYEHKEMSGEIPMHYLLKNTDSKYVAFELDIFWMQAAGADPKVFLETYPDRYVMLHLKDASEAFRFSGDGSTPDQWMAGFSKMIDPGEGVLDVEGILETAKKTSVQHFFLERDLAPDPMNTIKNSYSNLSKMLA
ncbi:MAG: TIM barrel protein [Bacteroidota bacterium]